MATASSDADWIPYAVAAILVPVVVLLAVVLVKNRRLHDGDVFVASRWTRGNRIFPAQVAVTPTSVMKMKPQWLGREEHSIHVGHVASVTIDTGLLFSDVIIETSGGSEPIVCHGHGKGDAVAMKELIELYQTKQMGGPAAALASGAAGPTRLCPFCAETIKAAATVCRYCARDLPPA